MNFVKKTLKQQYIFNLFPISLLGVRKHSLIVPDRCLKHNVKSFNNQELKCWNPTLPTVYIKRFKYKKSPEDEESDEELSDNDENDGDSKLITGHVQSLRTDLILKIGLGIARNKVEACFYEGKIRVNGKKIQKKSLRVKVGDEIDIIKGKNPMNESLLNISRVVLVSVKENENSDKLKIKMKRYKDVMIEDYSEEPFNKTEERGGS